MGLQFSYGMGKSAATPGSQLLELFENKAKASALAKRDEDVLRMHQNQVDLAADKDAGTAAAMPNSIDSMTDATTNEEFLLDMGLVNDKLKAEMARQQVTGNRIESDYAKTQDGLKKSIKKGQVGIGTWLNGETLRDFVNDWTSSGTIQKAVIGTAASMQQSGTNAGNSKEAFINSANAAARKNNHLYGKSKDELLEYYRTDLENYSDQEVTTAARPRTRKEMVELGKAAVANGVAKYKEKFGKNPPEAWTTSYETSIFGGINDTLKANLLASEKGLAQAVKEASDSKLTANQQIIADNKKDTLTLKHQKLEETIRKNKAAANNN